MILHIFLTKVMNRGLNSKRLVKKIKKMGKGLPQSLPGGKKVSPSYATASQSLAWSCHNTPSPMALSLWLWRASTAGARRRGCGVIVCGIGRE